MLRSSWRVLALDFDGTLVDSYSCLPTVWKRVGEAAGVAPQGISEFVSEALALEEEAETTGSYGKERVIEALLRAWGLDESVHHLLDIYWSERIARTKLMPCAIELLLEAKRAGLVVVSLSCWDGIPGLKRRRIAAAGLYHLFDEVIVAGENAVTKIDALSLLADKYEVPRRSVVLIDDRPSHVREAIEKGFEAILVRFRGPFRGPWNAPCSPSHTVTSLCEVIHIISTLSREARLVSETPHWRASK